MHWSIKTIYACLILLIATAFAVRAVDLYDSGDLLRRLWPVPLALLGLWIGWKKSH